MCECVFVCVRQCINMFLYICTHTRIFTFVYKSRKVKTLLFFLIVYRNLSSLDDQVYMASARDNFYFLMACQRQLYLIMTVGSKEFVSLNSSVKMKKSNKTGNLENVIEIFGKIALL